MFNRIAPTYDLLNDCISMGMHRGWKEEACQQLHIKSGHHVLDVCTGTGDLAKRLSELVGPQGRVKGLDFSEEMLAVARERMSHIPNLTFTQGDAMNLPYEANTFDGAVVAFGLRNVNDVPQTIAEMTRVVKPGGWIVNLDTCPNPKLPGYWFYFSTVMPLLGKLISKDPGAYSYLFQSTREFYSPQELRTMFKTAGLVEVNASTLSFGSVSIQAGQKPLS